MLMSSIVLQADDRVNSSIVSKLSSQLMRYLELAVTTSNLSVVMNWTSLSNPGFTPISATSTRLKTITILFGFEGGINQVIVVSICQAGTITSSTSSQFSFSSVVVVSAVLSSITASSSLSTSVTSGTSGRMNGLKKPLSSMLQVSHPD